MTGNLVEFLLHLGSVDVAGSLLCLTSFPYDRERDDVVKPMDYLSCWLSFLLVLILHTVEHFMPTKNCLVQKLISSTILLNFVDVIMMIVRYEQCKIEGHFIALLVAVFVFILPGIMIVLQTSYLFLTEGGGTPSPAPKSLRTQHLVIEAPYRYTRNPMVSAEVWLFLGLSVLFHSLRLLLFDVIFVLIGTTIFIFYEEPDLRNRFGQDYIDYCQNVPRWIPRRSPYYAPKQRAE